jgi:hypothetical protein
VAGRNVCLASETMLAGARGPGSPGSGIVGSYILKRPAAFAVGRYHGSASYAEMILPVPAATRSATTMEPSATMEAASRTTSGNSTTEPAVDLTRTEAMIESAVKASIEAPVKSSAVTIESSAVTIESEAVMIKVAVEAVEPRSCTDEYAAGKPVWTVVAVRRARVRVIGIVAPRAHRRPSDHYCRPNSDSHSHSNLCTGRAGHRAGHRNQKPHQSRIF